MCQTLTLVEHETFTPLFCPFKKIHLTHTYTHTVRERENRGINTLTVSMLEIKKSADSILKPNGLKEMDIMIKALVTVCQCALCMYLIS